MTIKVIVELNYTFTIIFIFSFLGESFILKSNEFSQSYFLILLVKLMPILIGQIQLLQFYVINYKKSYNKIKFSLSNNLFEIKINILILINFTI